MWVGWFEFMWLDVGVLVWVWVWFSKVAVYFCLLDFPFATYFFVGCDSVALCFLMVSLMWGVGTHTLWVKAR